MIYPNIKKATFISRPNRFIAHASLNGEEVVCHVKNTGRCRELLIPGATVFLQEWDNSARKTKYDLISVIKGETVVNMDSQAPNKVFHEWAHNFFEDITSIKPESKYKNSRFDFYIETKNRRIFVEVKGVTLEKDGVAMFPDAPTERGVKHIEELCDCIDDGFEAYIFFVVQMTGVRCFTPNRKTHKEFADALLKANEKGVNIMCVDCNVTPDTLEIKNFVDVVLN